jgi:hypothetical protein
LDRHSTDCDACKRGNCHRILRFHQLILPLVTNRNLTPSRIRPFAERDLWEYPPHRITPA